MIVEDVAKIVHHANKAYCEVHGDMSQKSWEEAEQWQRDAAISGVQYHLAHPNSPPSWSHEIWMQDKLKAGWTYGVTKDSTTKTHPDLIPYEQLSDEARGKDYLFAGIVRALAQFVKE